MNTSIVRVDSDVVHLILRQVMFREHVIMSLEKKLWKALSSSFIIKLFNINKKPY